MYNDEVKYFIILLYIFGVLLFMILLFFVKTGLKIQEIVFETLRKSKFSRGANPWTP